MFTKLRIFVLLAILVLTVNIVPAAWGDDGDPPATAPGRVEGFFERNFVLAEIIAVPIFLFLLMAAMASNTTTQTVRTDHQDFFKKPLGSSYTHIEVPKVPSTPAEIKNALLVFAVVYPLLRFTCLFGFFNLLYKFFGSCIDIFFR